MPIVRRVAAVCLPILLLAGCGGHSAYKTVPFRVGCEEAAGQGVAPGRASARLVAQANLAHQAQELKGFMLKDGYRTVVQRAARVECHSYSLGFGLTQCVAKAQLCSR